MVVNRFVSLVTSEVWRRSSRMGTVRLEAHGQISGFCQQIGIVGCLKFILAALILDVEPVRTEVRVLICNPGVLISKVKALKFKVAALSFEVNALTFEVGAVKLHVRVLNFNSAVLIFNSHPLTFIIKALTFIIPA